MRASQRGGATVGSSSIGARLESSLLCSFSILFLNRSSNSCGKKSCLGFLRAVLRLRFCFFFLGVITNCGILSWWSRQVNAKGVRSPLLHKSHSGGSKHPAKGQNLLTSMLGGSSGAAAPRSLARKNGALSRRPPVVAHGQLATP